MISPKSIVIKDNGVFPGNKLPVLYYPKVVRIPFLFPSRKIKALLKRNKWGNNWRAGIYTYHHYHSVSHEAMVVIYGSTRLLLGGDNGELIRLEKGDAIVIPAGVAHKNLGREKDVVCIGGYPGGMDYDMNFGWPEERPQADKNIRAVPLPEEGPVYGDEDPLPGIWRAIKLGMNL